MIPYGRQQITSQDVQAVLEILQSDWLTQGPTIERFEAAVAQACGARYAVAVCNATAALHLACLCAGLQPGQRLWTVPTTFVASANCGLYCGAQVDFVDIHPRTYTMDVEKLAQKLAHAQRSNTLPHVVIPVHLAGQSCEMQAIHAMAQHYGFHVIEDAAHAIGGQYQHRPIGNGSYSDMTIFSFHPVKIITTGEGGMVLTNDPACYEQLLRLRSHGITRQREHMTQWPAEHPSQTEMPPPWYYEQVELGFNYRMTDIQAALGLSQLQRLDNLVARRRALAKRYDQALAHLPLTLPWQHPDTHSAFHLYIVRLQPETLRRTHREIFEQLRQAGIGVNLHYLPVHLQPVYRAQGFRPGNFPEAERYASQAISLPLYPDLDETTQDRIIETLSRLLQDARR